MVKRELPEIQNRSKSLQATSFPIENSHYEHKVEAFEGVEKEENEQEMGWMTINKVEHDAHFWKERD